MTNTNITACPYTYDDVDELIGKNITAGDAAKWPCDVIICWAEIRPLVSLVRWLLSYGTSIVVVTGLLLNTISLIVLTRKRMRRKTANLYLSFLAVYDNLSLTLNFMVGVVRANSEWVDRHYHDNVWLCMFHGVCIELFNLLSTWIIVTFTVERFLMVKFPMRSRTWSPRRTLISIIIVSVLVLGFSLHKIGYAGFEGDSVFGYKACKTKRKLSGEIIYTHIALKTWVPAIIIVTLNTYIMVEITRNQRKRKQMVQTVLTRSDEKATMLLMVVSSSYVLFVMPYGIVQTAEVFWHATRMVPPGHHGYTQFMITKIRMKWSRAFFFFFYQFNFTINFFLYVASSKSTRFRHNLKKIVGMELSTMSTKENGHGTARNGAMTTTQHTRTKADQRNVEKTVPNETRRNTT